MSADHKDSTTNDFGNEEQIFHAARKIADSGMRTEYLDHACRGDTKLRARVDGLLVAHLQHSGLLNSVDADQSTADLVPKNQGASQQIGPYKLLHLLGEGGMGSVWLAEQQHPVKRRVAVKLIKQGLNSQQFIARFEAERQALAMMDHPNIAKVLDAGCSEDGKNYFVMEYVKGIPITEFCDENRLSAEDRLKLFINVCQAVQHAHQKGVIHRDLKPSNVMVAMYDDQPVPKVIDFGVAKASHQPLTEHTLCTVPGQIVGTWEYMSPEQAILNQLDVDTRTDIYSLAVVLYELLTGQTPLDLKSLKPEMLEERLRRIREQEPARPSNRVSSLGEAGVATAAYRNTEANSLSRKLRGDLDTIVMKALEKDRSNRYETANGFAAEIQRFLNDEPLSIRPPSTWQQLSRFYRRNRAIAATGLVVVSALAIGLSVAVWAVVDRQSTINELKGNAKELALIYSLSADFSRAREQIVLADKCGAEPGWLKFAEGQIAVFEGNLEEAKTLLEEAGEDTGSSIPPKALLAIALLFTGEETQHLDHLMEIKKSIQDGTMNPISAEDHFYLGFAFVWADPKRALDFLEEADKQNIPRKLLFLIRSLANSNAAFDEIDSEEAIQYAMTALKDAKEARNLLTDSPFPPARMIEAYTALAVSYRRAGIDEKSKEAIMTCSELVETVVERFPESGDATTTAYGYYLESAPLSEATDFLMSLRPSQLKLNLKTWRMIASFQYGSIGDAESNFETFEADKKFKYPLLALAQLSRNPSASQRKEIEAELIRRLDAVLESDLGSIDHIDFYWAVCRLLGSGDGEQKCIKEMKIRLEKYQDTYIKDLLEPIIEVAESEGELKAIELKATASRKRLAYAYFARGIVALARKDDRAHMYFKQCADEGYSRFYVCRFSRVMCAKLDNEPDWPPWNEDR